MRTLEIQRALKERGYDPGPLDMMHPSQTEKALRAFQAASGLVADGILGPLTTRALSAPAAAPIRAELPEPAWLTLARGDLGIVEGIGESNNPKVGRYFADAGSAGLKDDETAWCAAFVWAELKRSGHKPSGSLAAYEAWGVGLAKPVLARLPGQERYACTRAGGADRNLCSFSTVAVHYRHIFLGELSGRRDGTTAWSAGLGGHR